MRTSIALMVLSFLLVSCGNEDSDKQTTSTDQSIYNVDLSSASEGDQYIVMPYVLGDTTTINGKTSTSAGVFSISSDSASLSLASNLGLSSVRTFDFNHSIRTLINRFQPNAPLSREKTFRAIETLKSHKPNLLEQQKVNWEEGFLEMERSLKSAQKLKPSYPLQTSSCPTSVYTIGKTDPIPLTDGAIYAKSEKDDYCLVFIETFGDSEDDITNVETSVQTAINLYKTMFDTEFNESVTGYSFKPLIIILPFDDPTYWPAGFSTISGAFSSEYSATHQRPTIYMSSDQTLSGATAANEQDSFHSTMGHELFHAVFHYFRVWVNGGGSGESDTVSLDEGLAHLMEDALGYGALNFSEYAGSFLSLFPSSGESPYAILDETQDILDNINRGAAQTLFYYLMSQKGGIEFTSGKPSGGGGLSFLRTFVTGAGSGVSALASAYGGTWKEIFSDYLSAIHVDGSDMAETSHEVQAPSSITNLLGGTGTFGMRFTGHGDLPTLQDRLSGNLYDTNFDPSSLTDIAVDYYQVTPYLLTVTGTDASFMVVYDEAYTNSGVSVVRVK